MMMHTIPTTGDVMFSVIRKMGTGRKVVLIKIKNYGVYLFWWEWDTKNNNFGIVSKMWG